MPTSAGGENGLAARVDRTGRVFPVLKKPRSDPGAVRTRGDGLALAAMPEAFNLFQRLPNRRP